MTEGVQNRLKLLLENVGDMALKRRARELITGLDPQPGENILDLGCGDGFYLYLLSNLDIKLKLTGSDYEATNFASVRRNLKENNIRLVRGDLMGKLPFKDNTFDKIVMAEVAEHLPDDVKGFKEIKRILKPGGIICLSVPNANYPLFWDPVNWILEHQFRTHIKQGFLAGFWFNHIRLYTPQQLKKNVQKSGLKVEEIKTTTWWCLPFNHYLINIVARLLWGGKLSANISTAINKYETHPQKPVVIDFVFKLINQFDKLNDFYQPKDRGVGVVIKAVK